MTISRSSARELSGNATRTGAVVLGGQLLQESDQFIINKTNVTELLQNLSGQNVILVVSSVEDPKEAQVKTCLTCGRDYTGAECSHCANVRSRLRGTR